MSCVRDRLTGTRFQYIVVSCLFFCVQKVTFLLIKIHQKTVATKSCFYSLYWCKYAPNRLLAGPLPQTPLGSLQRFPRPLLQLGGLLLRQGGKGRGKGEKRGRLEGKVKEGKKRKGKKEKRGKGGKGGRGSSARPLFKCFRRLWSTPKNICSPV